MSALNLILGGHLAGQLWAFGEGLDDDGEVYLCRAQSAPIQAGGAHLEALFPAAYLWLRHRVEAEAGDSYDEVTLTVYAVLDGEDRASASLTLRLTPIATRSDPPAWVSRMYELVFETTALDESGATIGCFPPGGSTFALRVEWPGSEVAVDQAAVERDIVGESVTPANA